MHLIAVASQLAVGLILSTSTARAFRTAGELPEFEDTERVRWELNAVGFYLFEDSLPDVPLADIEQQLRAAAESWTALECAVEVVPRGLTAHAAAAGDGINTIQFIKEGWTDRGFRADAAGVTDTQYGREGDAPWRLIEADVYLNAEHHDWVAEGENDGTTRDVLSVLTHEIGHAIGLMHPCETDGADGAPICGSDAAFSSVAMYPMYDAGQATLTADEEQGACFLYPPPTCDCTLGEVCTSEGCAVECGDEVCPVDLVCSPEGCVTPDRADEILNELASCAEDDDCTVLERCESGRCVPRALGRAQPGDPCEADGDCSSGVCQFGSCALGCSIDDDCLDGQTCKALYGVGFCEGTGAAMGEPCEHGRECLGGECVAGAQREPICTRACGEPSTSCPDGWECTTVDRLEVCVIKQQRISGGGCSVAAKVSRSSNYLVAPRQTAWASPQMSAVWPFGIAVCACAARRRRRQRRHDESARTLDPFRRDETS